MMEQKKDRVVVTKGAYLTSAVKKEQYPEVKRPEFVFIGRSNVGKSSLDMQRQVRKIGRYGRNSLMNIF